MRRVTVSPSWRRCFSSSVRRRGETVPLAFTRYDSPSGSSSGPPIILMHGLFGSQRNNRTMSKILARDLDRPVYNVDLRNHGDSEHHPRHDYTAMALDVESFITTHSIPPPLLIGHSMGAKVAMTLALRQPAGYSGLVSVDNAPVDAALKSDFGTYVSAMRAIADRSPPIAKQSDADAILATYEPNLSVRQFLLTNLIRDPDSKIYRFRIPLVTLAKSLPDMADFPFKDPDAVRYEGPTLFARGNHSHYVSDEVLPLIGRFFPRFELATFECGHWVMSEKFEEFRAVVVEWVGRCVDGDR